MAATWIALMVGQALLGSGCDRDSTQPSKQKAAAPAPASTPTSVQMPTEVSQTLHERQVVEEVSPPPIQASTPVEKPAPVFQEAQVVPDWRPLLDAAAGEWVEYDTLDDRRIRYDVLKSAPSGVVIRITIRQAGRTWGEPALREDDPTWDPIGAEAQRRKATRSIAGEAVQAAGRKWEATVYEDRWVDEEIRYVRRTWVNPQVPYTGIIRMELHGDGKLEARLVLVDYGGRQAAR